MMDIDGIAGLRAEISACKACTALLPHSPRPIVQLSGGAVLTIVSQAPGRLVHDTGIPWNDASGARLRDWMGISPIAFYDPGQVALVPMGLCYPGRGPSGDLPPRPECATRWHDRVLSCLADRRLMLLVGRYAQARHLPAARRLSVTERVRAFDTLAPGTICLPHPSWRAAGWMRRNPWFGQDIIPRLRRRVAQALDTRT